MAESISVEHQGVTITTNTATEADLRTEMEAAPPSLPLEPSAEETAAPGPVRDDKGRFVPKGAVGAPPEGAPLPQAATPEPAAEPQTRRRDDSLPRHNPIARMNQALAKAAEAERRAAALEAELARTRHAGVTGQVTPQQESSRSSTSATNGHEPQFEQFAGEADPYTAYLQAWTRWDRAQGIAQARAEWDAAQAEQSRAKSFQERLTTGRQAYADFDQVLTEADTLGLQVSAVMQEAIADSPKAADLVYFLATHPEECLQLAEESQQTPVAAAPVMRRLLESQLQGLSAPRAVPQTGAGAAARATVSTAKPPVTPVGSSPVVSDEPPGDQASAAEHARYWNRRLKVPGT